MSWKTSVCDRLLVSVGAEGIVLLSDGREETSDARVDAVSASVTTFRPSPGSEDKILLKSSMSELSDSSSSSSDIFLFLLSLRGKVENEMSLFLQISQKESWMYQKLVKMDHTFDILTGCNGKSSPLQR